jgi:hypothetical protein
VKEGLHYLEPSNNAKMLTFRRLRKFGRVLKMGKYYQSTVHLEDDNNTEINSSLFIILKVGRFLCIEAPHTSMLVDVTGSTASRAVHLAI